MKTGLSSISQKSTCHCPLSAGIKGLGHHVKHHRTFCPYKFFPSLNLECGSISAGRLWQMVPKQEPEDWGSSEGHRGISEFTSKERIVDAENARWLPKRLVRFAGTEQGKNDIAVVVESLPDDTQRILLDSHNKSNYAASSHMGRKEIAAKVNDTHLSRHHYMRRTTVNQDFTAGNADKCEKELSAGLW